MALMGSICVKNQLGCGPISLGYFQGFSKMPEIDHPKIIPGINFLNIHIIHDVFSHLRSGATSRGEDPPVVGPSALSLSRAGSETPPPPGRTEPARPVVLVHGLVLAMKISAT